MAARRARTAALLSLVLLTAGVVRADPNDVDFDGGRPAAASNGNASVWDWLKLKLKPRPKPAAAPPAAAGGAGEVFSIVSWNVQTFGTRIKAARRQASADVIARIFGDPKALVFAAEEIANAKAADTLKGELERAGRWTADFEDSSDSQDNGFFVRSGARVECSGFLYGDRALSRHPARAAQIRVGDLDFTLVTVHLAYVHGHADASIEELRAVLRWVQGELARRGADPDVIIAGDFNLPTRAGKRASERSGRGDWTPVEDVLDEFPGLQMTALVDEPTSRERGQPANNYDHFIVSRHLLETAYVQGSARRLPESVVEDVEAQDGAQVSDHFPIEARLRSSGPGIAPDGQGACPLPTL